MSTAAVAERYARAIFELGEESGQLAVLADNLQKFNATLEQSPELTSVLSSPVIEEQKREAIVAVVAERLTLVPLALNTLKQLVRRRRLGALPEILERLTSFSDEMNGVVRVTVTSAQPMPESYFLRLSQQVHQSTGKRVILEKREDQSLIAGVLMQIGDNTIDGSLKGRLADYGRKLSSLQ